MINPGRYQAPSNQIVTYGYGIATQLPETLADFWASNAVLATNSSLAKPGGLAGRIKDILGENLHSEVTGLREQTPREDVIKVASRLRNKGFEAVVTLGGGSVVEAVKAARICLTNNVGTVEDMDRLRFATTAASPRPYLISIPTTLSGAEYTPYAGVTDPRTGFKDAFFHKDLAPDAVILDPEMTLDTPERLWLSTGLRALDNAIESWCSTNSAPASDGPALYAVRLLAENLPATKRDAGNLDARLTCQVASWMAIKGAAIGVTNGASQGIGQALSAVAGVAHGDTSCIMLPHVLRYNAAVNAERQKPLADAMGKANSDLGDLVAALVGELGLPARLRDVGVEKAHFAKIAELSLQNPRVNANPRPIGNAAQIEELLDAAW